MEVDKKSSKLENNKLQNPFQSSMVSSAAVSKPSSASKKHGIKTFLVYFSILIAFVIGFGLNYVWLNRRIIDPEDTNWFNRNISDLNKISTTGIVNIVDGFLTAQLIKPEELEQYNIAKLSNLDQILSVYNMEDSNILFLKQLFPNSANLPTTQQKLFYLEANSKQARWLDTSWLNSDNYKIQNIQEYNKDNKQYWLILESNRLIISEPLFVNPKSIIILEDQSLAEPKLNQLGVLGSIQNELVVSSFESFEKDKVCLNLVKTYLKTINRTNGYNFINNSIDVKTKTNFDTNFVNQCYSFNINGSYERIY